MAACFSNQGDVMDGTPRSLEDLRREIDDLDAGLHDLLMRRASVVADVAAHKAGAGARIAYRPAREAQILRRLLDRHDHRLPNSIIVRLWREILSATTRLQGTFRVAVPRPEDEPGLLILGREHFGCEVILAMQGSALQTINAVREGEAEVGIVSWPSFEEEHPWWAALLQGGDSVPQIVARLPFLRKQPDVGRDQLDALVIGAFDRGESGFDRSIVAVECGAETSRGAVYDAVVSAGLEPELHAIWATRTGDREVRWHMVDIKGYVRNPDEQLSDISLALGAGLRGARLLGGYATPVAAEPSAP